jgi:uridine kinase
MFDDIENKFNKNSNKIFVIGIDGLGGAGKTTLSKTLEEHFLSKKISALQIHLDDFILPKKIRYNDNYEEWYCYYKLQWRFDYFKNIILEPIKEMSLREIEVEYYDKNSDSYFLSKIDFNKIDVLIVEGVFLQREELNSCFDYVIYISTKKEERLSRVINRDVYIGDTSAIISKYEKRYFPAEDFYVSKYEPENNADYIIKN